MLTAGSSIGALYAEQFPRGYGVTGSGFAFNISSRIGSISGVALAPYVIGLYGMANPRRNKHHFVYTGDSFVRLHKEAGDIELAQ